MRHHHTAYQSPRKIGTLVLLGLAAGLLAGCETNNGPSNPLSELVAYSSGARASAGAQASARHEVRQPEKPQTRAQAATDCWALVEKSRTGASLESRADFVNDCIDKRLKTTDSGSKSDAKSDAKSGARSDARPAAAAPKPRQRAEAKPAS